MSAIQINKRTKGILLDKYKKKLLSQADSFYNEKHFKIGTFGKSINFHTILMENALSNDNCEVNLNNHKDEK